MVTESPSVAPSETPAVTTSEPEPTPTVTETVTVTETAVPTGPSEIVLGADQFAPILAVLGLMLALVAFMAVLAIRRG